jgi:hypothetical protein
MITLDLTGAIASLLAGCISLVIAVNRLLHKEKIPRCISKLGCRLI